MIQWCNGSFLSEATINITDRGFMLADGLFETIRVEQGRAHDLPEHLNRLFSGCAFFEINLPYSPNQLKTIVEEVISQNAFLAFGRLRITVTRGSSESPTLAITLKEERKRDAPVELVLSNVLRVAGNPTSRFKTLSYTDNLFAQRAIDPSYGKIALLKNQFGRIACASIGNVFANIEGRWITPPIDEGALPGIERGKLLERKTFRGLEVMEATLTTQQLKGAPALFTNSMRGIVSAQFTAPAGSITQS